MSQTASAENNVLIRDREDINRAVDGDQVIIEIYPKSAWKAESEYLVPNNAEEKVEEKVEKSDDDASSHVLSGRVVAIAKRCWKTYCGSIEPIPEGNVQGSVMHDHHLPRRFSSIPSTDAFPKSG